MSVANAEVLKALWDFEYDHPVSVRNEFEEPLTGRDEIARECDYYAAIALKADCVCESPVVQTFGDYAVAFCVSVLTLSALGEPAPHRLVSRNTLVFRHVGGKWKLIHFHESADPESDPRLGIVTPLPEVEG